ncbi:hypothetical protein [Hyphococcus sp.]|uniref:hypothetical protein n=1 Tax=Hyphococcus sp. TaxID=2038636 RepID=UPI0035C778FC
MDNRASSNPASPSRDKMRGDNDAAKVLDLLALWDGECADLRRAIEDQTDWGPFELVEMTPAFYDVYGLRRILCRFVFHGEADARAPFEKDLRRRLAAVTDWKEAPRAKLMDAPHSETLS